MHSRDLNQDRHHRHVSQSLPDSSVTSTSLRSSHKRSHDQMIVRDDEDDNVEVADSSHSASSSHSSRSRAKQRQQQ